MDSSNGLLKGPRFSSVNVFQFLERLACKVYPWLASGKLDFDSILVIP